MAGPRTPSPSKKREQLTAHPSIDFEACMQRAEEQKALALEMIKRTQEMCDRAEEMRKRPRLTFP